MYCNPIALMMENMWGKAGKTLLFCVILSLSFGDYISEQKEKKTVTK